MPDLSALALALLTAAGIAPSPVEAATPFAHVDTPRGAVPRSATWAQQSRNAQSINDPSLPNETRMAPEDVARTLVEYGHWLPERARQRAETVPVWLRDGEQGYGGFWPGPRTADGPIGRVEVDQLPAAEFAKRLEHELRHSDDWTTQGDDGNHGYNDAAVKARMQTLAALADPQYASAASWARSILAEHGDDTAHLHHFLIDRLGFDYNAIPPAYRQSDFSMGDTSYHAPEAVNPFGPTPKQVPTPLGYRVVLPLAGR
jgi:hypothetical protein